MIALDPAGRRECHCIPGHRSNHLTHRCEICGYADNEMEDGVPVPPCKPQSLADMMAEDDARRMAEARAEIAAEQAEWDALTPDQKAARIAAMEAKYADVPDDDGDNDGEDD